MITKTLASTTLSSATASITFSGISTIYKDLVLVTSTVASTSSPSQFVSVQFNGNTSNLYINCYLFAGNATTSTLYKSTGSLRDYLSVGITRSATNSNHTNNAITQIFDYNATDKWKATLTEANDTSQDYYGITAGSFQSTSAITSIVVKHDTGNLGAGTIVTLMGVA
jgi:hypothetical protein